MRIELINLLAKKEEQSICGICTNQADTIHILVNKMHFKVCKNCIKRYQDVY